MISRRRFFAASAASLAMGAVGFVRQVRAAPLDGVLQDEVRKYLKGAIPKEGRVTLEIAPLVENGNSVPISVVVASPMTPQNHVVSIAVFNEKNPQPDVAIFRLSPANGLARVSTRIRLASTQRLCAVASLNDGTHWVHTVEVLVTLASCIEE